MWKTTIPWLLQLTGWIPTKFWVVYQGWIACWVMLCRPSILTTLCTKALFLLAFLGGTLLGSVLCARSLWLVVVAGQGSLYTFWVKKQGCIARQSFQCRPSVFATQHMENLWLFAVTAWGPSRTQATFPSSLALEGHWAWPYQVQRDLLRLHSLVDYAVLAFSSCHMAQQISAAPWDGIRGHTRIQATNQGCSVRWIMLCRSSAYTTCFTAWCTEVPWLFVVTEWAPLGPKQCSKTFQEWEVVRQDPTRFHMV